MYGDRGSTLHFEKLGIAGYNTQQAGVRTKRVRPCPALLANSSLASLIGRRFALYKRRSDAGAKKPEKSGQDPKTVAWRNLVT